MADEADRAQRYIEAELDAAIRAARGQVPPRAAPVAECTRCGEPLPAVRQALGVTQCVPCAERVESLRARGLL